MPLSQRQVTILKSAIANYSHPCIYYDFQKNEKLVLPMGELEKRIQDALLSQDSINLKDGLSNVIYWGYAKMGIQCTRVSRFRSAVTDDGLLKAAYLFRTSKKPSPLEIKKLSLPEFSGVSFVSKVRMFLDPSSAAVLDRQIMKMSDFTSGTVLGKIRVNKNCAQIPINHVNSIVYEEWNEKLIFISKEYFSGFYRAADIERGFFSLIQGGNVIVASEIFINS